MGGFARGRKKTEQSSAPSRRQQQEQEKEQADNADNDQPYRKPAANSNVEQKPEAGVAARPPLPQTVDTLLNQPAPPPPVQPRTNDDAPAPRTRPNRPARRRRAKAVGLNARENLSATGSVLEKGRLVENVPRRMRVNRASKAEVRITRAQMKEITSEFDDLSSSHVHELAVTEAMTVQLRAPGSGFHIENLSPQTQWIDRNQRHIDDADFGVWRWNVTPTKAGKSRLQLVISARTVDDEGTIHIADMPDKIIELSVSRDHGQMIRQAGIIAAVALAGVLAGRFGDTAWSLATKLAGQLG